MENKYLQGTYLSEGSPSTYNKMRCLVSQLAALKELEGQNEEFTHTELEFIHNKVNNLTNDIHSWWENKLDNMIHKPLPKGE